MGKTINDLIPEERKMGSPQRHEDTKGVVEILCVFVSLR